MGKLNMKHTNQKNIKLVSELMCFCYHYDATNINIEVDHRDKEIEINLEAHIKNMSEEVLNTVKEMLSSPRFREIEEYYWNLGGGDDTDCELVLVGMMIDSAKVDYNRESEILKINLIRKLK